MWAKLLSNALALFNRVFRNIERAEDMEAGANKLRVKQFEEREKKRRAADRIDARPDRNRLRRDDGDDPG